MILEDLIKYLNEFRSSVPTVVTVNDFTIKRVDFEDGAIQIKADIGENIRIIAEEIHDTAKSKGWWTTPSVIEKLALVHCEVSEAIEDYRDSKTDADLKAIRAEKGTTGPNMYSKHQKPEGFPIELADIIIRVLDLAEYLKIDMSEALRQKIDYNKVRPIRHGGKRA